MTRHLMLSGAMLLVFAASAFSQKAEVFGGYSYQHMGGQGLNGVNASITGNMNSWLGLTGELSHHSYGASITDPLSGFSLNADAGLLAFRVGPKFKSRLNDTATFFIHTLAGGYRASVNVGTTGFNQPSIDVNASATGFTAAAGAGLDIRVAPIIAIRPVQMDWIYLGSTSIVGQDSGSSNGFRYSGGIVLRF
jgi:hypothetical protein